jgi:flagellar hook assembly protein FlgD
LSAYAALARGPVINTLTVTPSSISPNGDRVSDSLTVTYSLSDTAAVHVLILENDAATVVDTLRAAATQLPGIGHRTSWHGTYANGTPVPDDSYFVFVRAVAQDAVGAPVVDSTLFVVFVDRVRPQVVVTDVFPSTFAPGAPRAPSRLTAEFDVFDPYPSAKVDVRVEILRLSARIATVADTTITPGDHQTETWAGGNISTEGTYTVKVLATDRASNSHEVRTNFEVDLLPPEIETTNLGSGASLRVIPDSLFGWAVDRASVIDSLLVRYSAPAPFVPIPSTAVGLNDTVFFAIQLTDSVVEQEKEYSIGLRAVDPWGRETISLFTITWDTIPPAPPVLNQPASPTRNPSVALTGSDTDDTSVLRFFRNGVLADTTLANRPGFPGFPHTMMLHPGENRIYAVAVDQGGNASSPSNEIAITLDSSPGLLISQPFKPGDAFVVNLAETASSVTLRIYDLGGRLVKTLQSDSPGTNLLINWNGRNGDNDPVNKGPLVAVAQIHYQSGGSEVFREVFLFER